PAHSRSTTTSASTTTTSTAVTTTSSTSVTSTTAATTSSTTTSSSSTTTVAPPPTTTTTLPKPPCVIGTSTGCDDGNPCTTDTCTATGCLHDPLSGFAAVTSAFPTPDPGPRGACPGQPIPQAVTQRWDQGLSLLGRASGGGRVKQTRRFLLKAAKALRGAAKQAALAGKHGHLSPACVDALRSPLTDAAARASHLASTL